MCWVMQSTLRIWGYWNQEPLSKNLTSIRQDITVADHFSNFWTNVPCRRKTSIVRNDESQDSEITLQWFIRLDLDWKSAAFPHLIRPTLWPSSSCLAHATVWTVWNSSICADCYHIVQHYQPWNQLTRKMQKLWKKSEHNLGLLPSRIFYRRPVCMWACITNILSAFHEIWEENKLCTM